MRRFVGVLANRNVGYLLVIALLGIPMLLGISYMARSFGDGTLSSTTDDVAASSPSSWFLVPLDLAMLIASFHLMNIVAHACGRWTTARLGVDEASAQSHADPLLLDERSHDPVSDRRVRGTSAHELDSRCSKAQRDA